MKCQSFILGLSDFPFFSLFLCFCRRRSSQLPKSEPANVYSRILQQDPPQFPLPSPSPSTSTSTSTSLSLVAVACGAGSLRSCSSNRTAACREKVRSPVILVPWWSFRKKNFLFPLALVQFLLRFPYHSGRNRRQISRVRVHQKKKFRSCVLPTATSYLETVGLGSFWDPNP